MNRWFLRNGGLDSGPFGDGDLDSWGQSGQLHAGMMLRHEDSEAWTSIWNTPFARYLPKTKMAGVATKLGLSLFTLTMVVGVLLVCRWLRTP